MSLDAKVLLFPVCGRPLHDDVMRHFEVCSEYWGGAGRRAESLMVPREREAHQRSFRNLMVSMLSISDLAMSVRSWSEGTITLARCQSRCAGIDLAGPVPLPSYFPDETIALFERRDDLVVRATVMRKQVLSWSACQPHEDHQKGATGMTPPSFAECRCGRAHYELCTMPYDSSLACSLNDLGRYGSKKLG